MIFDKTFRKVSRRQTPAVGFERSGTCMSCLGTIMGTLNSHKGKTVEINTHFAKLNFLHNFSKFVCGGFSAPLLAESRQQLLASHQTKVSGLCASALNVWRFCCCLETVEFCCCRFKYFLLVSGICSTLLENNQDSKFKLYLYETHL